MGAAAANGRTGVVAYWRQTRRRKVGTERCLRNRFKVRQFLVFLYPEEAGLAPSRSAGVVRDGKGKRAAPPEAVGCTIDGG